MASLALTTLILAAEEAEDHGESGGLDLLLPATAELIAGIIAFLIVFFFVWKWAVPALNRILEARQTAIAGQIEEAEKAKQEARKLEADYQAELDEARRQRSQIMEDARAEADAMKAELVEKARADADGIVAKAREDAEAERNRVLADARQEVANLSIDLAERVVGENLDRGAQQALVERYIRELEQ